MSWLTGSTVIYQIFIDRFAGFNSPEGWDKPDFLGGNIRGIIEHFGYLCDLDIDAIWLPPFFQGVAYHGYHVTDFYAVDKHFGTEADLIELINLAHAHDIKVICDFIPNHCSTKHPFFIDALKDKTSRYRNWFYFDKHNQYLSFLHFNNDLAKINLDNEEAMKYIIGAAKKWLTLGLDGFRIDHVIGLSADNMSKLTGEIYSACSDAVLIGELKLQGIQLKDLKTIKVSDKFFVRFFNARRLLYKKYSDSLDGFLDFKTMDSFGAYAQTKRSDRAAERIKRWLKSFKNSQPVTFLDNHDDERFLFRCGGDVERLKRAAALQMSLPFPTVIYYGTEIGMTQSAPFSSRQEHSDLLTRQPMRWKKSEQNMDLLEFYKSIIKKRHTSL